MNTVNEWILSIINDAEANLIFGRIKEGSYLLSAARYLLINLDVNMKIDFNDICSIITRTNIHLNYIQLDKPNYYFKIQRPKLDEKNI